MRYTATIALLLLSACAAQAQLALNTFPSRQIGQNSLTSPSGAANRVEGRELAQPQSVAVDKSVTPPILYVADTNNNRVLAWRNASAAGAGSFADAVIGQTDKTSTNPQGAVSGSTFLSGLYAPTGLAVDSSGNLYVVDAGSNRILRFPKPFQQVDQSADRITADFVIGQSSFSTNAPATSDTGIATFANGLLAQAGMAFDSNGNLWFSDPLNNRVLRYPASSLKSGSPNGPAADIVLGQFSFTTNTGVSDRQDKTKMYQPSSLAFDSAGRLFVVDGGGRVLVYPANSATGQVAVRLMGVIPPTQANPRPPTLNEQTLGAVRSNGSIIPPTGVYVIGNTPYVVDTPNNRVLRYAPFDQWPAEGTQFSPSAVGVVGQGNATDFTNNKVNRGGADANASSFNVPTTMSASATEAFVVDTGNNRVLAFGLDGSNMRQDASRVIGQLDFAYSAINLIEGKEFFFQNGRDAANLLVGGGIVVDKSSNPPRLYVADTWNNRILGFKDARSVKPTDRADIVIGQPDFFHNQINYPNNDVTRPGDQGLYLPIGLAVDASGNLYVADSGNARVVRYPSPFNNQQSLRPDIVLGQASFTAAKKDPDSRTMGRPYGVTIDVDGNVLVSDATWNRVLFFRKPSGDFTINQAAEKVFGQPDFFTITGSNAPNRMNSPRGIAIDGDSRLYVADGANGRVLIYGRVAIAPPDPSPAITIPNLNGPLGVFVSQDTGEIWVTNTFGNQVQRYARFDQLVFNAQPNTTINSGFPMAVTLDSYGNLLVAEASNRITFYYPGTVGVDGAAFTQRPLSPGGYVSLFPPSKSDVKLAEQTASASGVPYPTQLGDVQVLINGTPAPLAYVSPTQINLIVPNSAPTSGFTSVEVVQVSTGRLYAATQQAMAVATPALFTRGGTQIAAINPDGTINAPGAGVARGQIIQLYGTGYGNIPNAPPDGQAAGTAIPISLPTRVIIGSSFTDVLYSGLSPQFPGLWQINAKVPDATPPGTVPVGVVLADSYLSTDNGAGGRLTTTITVKDK